MSSGGRGHGSERTRDGENRTRPVRDITYLPAPGWAGSVEVTDIDAIVRRGGLREFEAPQRLGFELLVHVEHGGTRHEVDFTVYDLRPGDIMWVHEGQLQQWGDVTAIHGPVLMFPASIFTDSSRLVLDSLGTWERNHWPGAGSPGSPLRDELHRLPEATATSDRDLGLDQRALDSARVHAMIAVLLRLAGSQVQESRAAVPRDEVFLAFRSAVDDSFATHRSVAGYARQLGYSERTLNRATRASAGMTAKALIDERVLLEAKRRLVFEPTPVNVIARQLGFDDAANFSKFFAHRVGVTPGVFRTSRRRPA